jgi:putative hydrolase of the HAD superfamily
MLKAILIDVGGPLVDEEDFYKTTDRLVLDLLTQSGRKIAKEEYEEVLRRFTSHCFPNPRRAALWHFIKPDLGKFRQLQEALDRERRGWRAKGLQAGASEAVAALAGRYRLALAGNQPARVKELLQSSGILEYFQFQQVSEELGVAKPDPLFFQIILDSVGVEPAEAVMVGDRLDYDIYPARLLGMRTVRVLVRPYAEQEPPTPFHKPDITIDTIVELPKAISQLESSTS